MQQKVRRPICVRKPEDTGFYNSKPHETKFFSNLHAYDGFFGQFFLTWYSQVLIDHCDQVLAQANIVFEYSTVAKLPCIHWWYNSKSHAAEFTAGFYHKTGRNGYVPNLLMLKKHKTALNLTGVELRTLDQYEEFPEALADPEDFGRCYIMHGILAYRLGLRTLFHAMGDKALTKFCKMSNLMMVQMKAYLLSPISG
ncbi:Beta-amylase 2, chloroplastic [Sesamum angolense]|uniref:Beta-amylase n=1 Tax=Sesamum angolense TaxID=2727404 RepID=A0AAE1WTC8_9LAMI|nr:Beta-amylase 2, chloroplastic [Sesamum angolense]